MAAYEALKKKKKKKKNPLAPRASGKSIVVARTGPTASKRHADQRAHRLATAFIAVLDCRRFDVSPFWLPPVRYPEQREVYINYTHVYLCIFDIDLSLHMLFCEIWFGDTHVSLCSALCANKLLQITIYLFIRSFWIPVIFT